MVELEPSHAKRRGAVSSKGGGGEEAEGGEEVVHVTVVRFEPSIDDRSWDRLFTKELCYTSTQPYVEGEKEAAGEGTHNWSLPLRMAL